MPLELRDGTAVLHGVVDVEEAGTLAEWLRQAPDGSVASVDLSDCTDLHTAALQALLSARSRLTRPPTDDFLRRWVAPLLTDHATPAVPQGG